MGRLRLGRGWHGLCVIGLGLLAMRLFGPRGPGAFTRDGMHAVAQYDRTMKRLYDEHLEQLRKEGWDRPERLHQLIDRLPEEELHSGPLPYLIGAHAAVQRLAPITRDGGRFGSYFLTVEVVSPDSPDPSSPVVGHRAPRSRKRGGEERRSGRDR